MLKAAGYTVIGAACGALVGGPVGLLAGAKIGNFTVLYYVFVCGYFIISHEQCMQK